MSQILYKPIEVPSKYDIIPIHASDISSFLQCRRRWSWSSPTKTNLRRKVQLYGINPNLWFGTGIHYALEKYYNPLLKRDPVEVFQTWFEWQWKGGHIPMGENQNMLDQVYDLEPTPMDSGWNVRGLKDLLPQPDEEEFLAYRELGVGMMTFYKDYAQKNDDFEVVAAESQFSVPLGFTAMEVREESPNYGRKLDVHLRGKRDAIIFYPDRKDKRLQYGIADHKTAQKVDDDYFLKLENDPQCSTYIVATVHEAREGDFPWTEVRDVLYNTIRKAYPKPPSVTSRGFPSLDRQKESTTPQMFVDSVRNLGLVDWFHEDSKAQSYYEYLMAIGDANFVQRDHAIRNPHEIEVHFQELQSIAKEMVNPKTVYYKHASGMSYCTHCAFRAPCLAMDDGSDWQEMLAQGYEINRGR